MAFVGLELGGMQQRWRVTTRCTTCSTSVTSSGCAASSKRSGIGSDKTQCGTGTCGMTGSTRCAGQAANAKLLERARDALALRLWSPHAATIVIGITFFFMLMLVGGAYTDVLAELARGMANSLPARFMPLLAMLLGAAWGGWTAGRFRSTRVNAAQTPKCMLGGVLMGWSSLLIPGGNDGLILVGMPLLWP